MFLKKTLKTDSKSGKTYSAYHLVESVRTQKGPRQRTLLYMGSEIKLPEGEHKLLAQCIEGIILGENPLLPYPEHIDAVSTKSCINLMCSQESANFLRETGELGFKLA